MKSLLLTTFATVAAVLAATAGKPIQTDDVWQHPGADRSNYRRNICIPDIGGYRTLKCDFHIHTCFSDGQVYPTGRVNEAWSDGLDVIAITDHFEIRKNRGMQTDDMNLPYEIAAARGREIGLLVIPGGEITRHKPFGHINALFLKDGNRFPRNRTPENEQAALDEALAQDAYLFWNHPGWPNDSCTLYPMHERLLREGKIRGVEIFNSKEHYPRVLQWYERMGFSMLANSDIHYPSGQQYPEGARRPMTLVFATDCTAEAVREALFAGRMVALYDHTLAGPETYIRQLVEASLTLRVVDARKSRVEISNRSDIRFSIRYGDYMYPVAVPPHQTVRLTLPRGTMIRFENCVLGYDKCLEMALW